MFVPPQFREEENPPTSRAVLSKKEDGSVELSFPDIPSAESIKMTEPTRLAIRERPKPNPKPATASGPAIEDPASKTPAHGKNSKKRAAAKSPDMGDFELGMHDAKREDTGTHEDKTVSMDKYWKDKAAAMNIDAEDMKIPQGTDKSGPSAPYEGAVSGIPPLSNAAISQLLMKALPNNNKARMWVKAQEAADLARKRSQSKEKVKGTLSAAEALLKGEPPQRVNPLIARINEMEKNGHGRSKRGGTKRSTAQRIAAAEKMQAEKKGGRGASTAKAGSSKSAAPARKNEPVPRGHSMDLAAVRQALAEIRAKEAALVTENADEATDESSAEPVAKANAPASDISLELAKRIMQEREVQAGVINSIDEAQHRLLKAMYGDDYPKPKARTLPFEVNDPRAPEGFADLQKEKAYHAALIDHVEQARLRNEATMSEMRAFIEKKRKERLEAEADPDATEDELPDSKPSTPDDKTTVPMGLHRTPEAVEKMEQEREDEQEYEIDPEAMKRVQNASRRLQRALFGDEIPKVNYNKKKF